jgi:hypothetical protein
VGVVARSIGLDSGVGGFACDLGFFTFFLGDHITFAVLGGTADTVIAVFLSILLLILFQSFSISGLPNQDSGSHASVRYG